MPDVLKFRGLHKLKVERCSDPSNVKWENLDTHWYVEVYPRESRSCTRSQATAG